MKSASEALSLEVQADQLLPTLSMLEGAGVIRTRLSGAAFLAAATEIPKMDSMS